MIVYSGTKNSFRKDTINGLIASKLDELFASLDIGKEGYAEFKSWKNSLPQMSNIIADERIDGNVQVALEYQIPLTSKRVDFMVGGSDGSRDNVVIIELKQWEGFEAQWNFDTNGFATDPESFEQVGCIHSTQGLEFDYVGIIIGCDMQFKNGKVVTDYNKRYLKRDKTISNVHTEDDKKLADRIIRNTYKTLLSRGQKGCYIYCEDRELSEYLKLKLKRKS